MSTHQKISLAIIVASCLLIWVWHMIDNGKIEELEKRVKELEEEIKK